MVMLSIVFCGCGAQQQQARGPLRRWRAAALCLLCLVASSSACPMDALCCQQLHWPALRLCAVHIPRNAHAGLNLKLVRAARYMISAGPPSLTDSFICAAAGRNVPTAVGVPAKRVSCIRAGKGSSGAAPAAGIGKVGTIPQLPPASTGGLASSSQGPIEGQALAAGKVKASQMLHRRTDLGRGSGGTDVSRQAVAPAADGSKPGGGQQPRSSGRSKPGSGQQLRSSGAGKENQAAAANKGAAWGRGAGGKNGCDGAEKCKGVAGLGEPAGEDAQPKKRAEKRKAVAEVGEPAGKDTQPKNRTEKRKAVAGVGEPAGQPKKRADKRKGSAGLEEPAGKDVQPKKKAPASKQSELLGVRTGCGAGSSRSIHHQGD